MMIQWQIRKLRFFSNRYVNYVLVAASDREPWWAVEFSRVTSKATVARAQKVGLAQTLYLVVVPKLGRAETETTSAFRPERQL
jgi:hypothetical protein